MTLIIYFFLLTYMTHLKDPRGRVTQKVLSGSGLLKEGGEAEEENTNQANGPENDFWNLSNDQYYNPRMADSVGKNLGTLNLQVHIRMATSFFFVEDEN